MIGSHDSLAAAVFIIFIFLSKALAQQYDAIRYLDSEIRNESEHTKNLFTLKNISANNAQNLRKRALFRPGFEVPLKYRDLEGTIHRKIKIAIFDTGLADYHPDFLSSVKSRSDWTRDGILSDTVGHGSFVAGVIASANEDCPGIVPYSTELYIFRVFDSNQMTSTSWFLDAMNYALHIGVDIINLSNGCPDHGDLPFIDKVNELAAAGVIIVSAIGNDGPVWGTLNNPGDMASVIGVGGYAVDTLSLAKFSSRGMTT